MNKSLRTTWWLVSGFVDKHKKIIFLGISAGILLSVLLIWILPFIPRPNPTITIGLIGQKRSNELPDYISFKVSQGLTATGKDGAAIPILASDWVISDDKKTYTFFLKDNIYWQDETLLKAQDLNYNFSDVETKYLDDYTIQFKLNEKFSPFPTLLQKPVFKNGYIGTSDYKIKDIKVKLSYLESLTLESERETEKIKFYPNLDMAKMAFKMGEISEIREVYTNPFAQDETWLKYLNIEEKIDKSQYVALFINNNDQNLGNKNFRQGLAYATIKPSDESRAIGPISPDSWAFNEKIKTYDYNQERAKELITKVFGEGKNPADVNLTISTTLAFLDMAEQIAKNWHDILGINVNTQIINSIPQNYQILLASQEISADPDQYAFWHSTQKNTNITGFNSPRIDKLLETGRQEFDQATRKEIYADFQKYLLEESPAIFISYPKVYNIKRKSYLKPIIYQLLNFGTKKEETTTKN
ncbi:hypothetical protein GYA19_04840 [Candidatus Beckwithbacteria bacterium]|nr:hypothetical protein [Candidatus Beckwithbacteria bacterium]